MSPEHWQQVSDLFHAVLEAEPFRRRALLESADPEVRSEVEGLLSGSGSESNPLDHGVLSHAYALLGDEAQSLIQPGERANLGQYEVQSLLGRGGMGEVYLAHDRKLGRDVAIKTLPKEFSENLDRLSRFQREARVLASLNHHNIAAIYALEEWAGVNFLILEMVEGETLTQRLQRAGPMSVGEALRIMCQVANALDAAHRKGITHRDIKPANIKVTPDGQVKVLDFGLAKVSRAGAAAGTENVGLDTESGRILGTPRYMSPEQARGLAVDHRTDIWAFGCVLYELLTARPALRGDTVSDIIAAILEREPDYSALPDSTPVQVRRLIQRCLAKDLDKRHQDIAQVRAAMEHAQERPRYPRFTRRRLAISVATIVAAMAPVAINLGGLRDRWFASGPKIQSLAVLPLANLSGNPDQEYFSDGMTESLIKDLAKIGAIRIISRTSVMTYKETKKPLRQIAEELRVDAVLKGSALRFGNRIRVNLQFIDGKNGRHIWGESYDRELSDVLRLRSEVVQAVTQLVRAQMTPRELARLASTRTVNPEAHNAYLQGMYQANRGAHDAAQRQFELALAMDPNSARAYAGIARVWTGRTRSGLTPPAEAWPKVMVALQRALALDNTLAEVHTALATSQAWAEWDWSGAEVEYRRAIDLDPNDADARAAYGTLLNILKRRDEAMVQIERAVELDPHNSSIRGDYAINLNYAFRYQEAELEARRSLAANPLQRSAMSGLRIALIRQAKHKEVLEVHRDNFEKRGFPELARTLQQGYERGRYREAFEGAAQMLEARWRQGRYVQIADIAALYDAAGRSEKCLDWWETAAARHDANMPAMLLTLPQGSVRADNPRFQAILRRVGFPTGVSIYQAR